MKSIHKFFLGAILLTGLLSAWSGCIGPGGGVGVGVYGGGPWFHDDVWLDGGGRGWYGRGGGGYVHPGGGWGRGHR